MHLSLYSKIFISLILIFTLPTVAGSHGLAKSCVKSEIQISSQSLEHQEEHSHAEKTQSGDFSAQWSGGEHKQLGDLGFINACKLLGSYQWDICKQNTIHRYDKKLPISYGQVLALGDFYLNPQKAFLEKRRVNSINKLFRCIDKEGNVHEEQRSNP